jgi:hypothetical protein
MREDDLQILEGIIQSFTNDQATEYARRIRTVDMLLSRVHPKCEELASEIAKQRKDEKHSGRLFYGLLIAVVVLWVLRSLSVVSSDSIFYLPLIMFLFLLARMHFAPEGSNAVALSTLKILTFTLITRIEELGVSERFTFLWVQKVARLDASLLREIRDSYLSAEYAGEDYVSLTEDDDEDKSETDGEVDTSYSWGRVCLEVARAVRRG